MDTCTTQSPGMIEIDHALAALRKQGRRVIRVIDNACGDGGLLIRATERALELGFVALDGRGFDWSVRNVAAARTAAAAAALPGVRLVFVQRLHKLPIAADCRADLVLADPLADSRAELDAILDPHGAIVMRTMVPPSSYTLPAKR